MNSFAQNSAAAAIAVVLAISPALPSQGGSRGWEHRSKDLATLLKSRGYAKIPLTRSKTGLLDVRIAVDSVPMLLVLDTGANNLNLDRASAKRAKLTIEDIKEKTAAAGGAVPASVTTIKHFSLGEIIGPAQAYVVDFAPVNSWRKECGDPACDGVLGGSFLKYYRAVIDCAGSTLFLLEPAQRAKKLTNAMEKHGYLEVPLTLNKNGLLDVDVKINNLMMLLFLDTGYPTTISLERSSAERAHLKVTKRNHRFVLGGGLAIGQTKIDQLSVGEVSCVTDAEVMDFSPTNATRKAYGAPRCDGALGAHFFRRYSAVIDYAHSKLYLLRP